MKIQTLFVHIFWLLIIPLLFSSASAEWISINYRNMLDLQDLVRTGETVEYALRHISSQPAMQGALQPFLDQQLVLVKDAVEMIEGVSARPLINLQDTFLPGSAQPAWVALQRGGQFLVAADGADQILLLVPGADPRLSYKKNYTLVRHALADALVTANTTVRVYAFEHQRSKTSFKLNPVPYKFKASSFGLPAGLVQPDLNALTEYFAKPQIITAAGISPRQGLFLAGEPRTKPTMMGFPLSLADLAVAYRAVFHSGDNAAFISLDPHPTPWKTRVNFGGYLEDTRLGSVVLESDKRFKTFTSGLDPNAHTDMRSIIRATWANYLSTSERDVLNQSELTQGWVGTRFWFYPESVAVDTDAERHYVVVRNSQMTADAERSKDDFDNPQEFDKNKQKRLSPSIRTNIDDLNRNYDQYAKVFPEFGELRNVAVLFAICRWLQTAGSRGIDWDALLGVELPVCSTERERIQMMASATLVTNADQSPVTTDIENVQIQYISPILEQNIVSYFGTVSALMTYLTSGERTNLLTTEIAKQTAERVWQEQATAPVHILLTSKKDLQALAIYEADRSFTWPEGRSGAQRRSMVVEIGGGIDLSPQQFTIKTNEKLSVPRKLYDQVNAPLPKQPDSVKPKKEVAEQRIKQIIQASTVTTQPMKLAAVALTNNPKTSKPAPKKQATAWSEAIELSGIQSVKRSYDPERKILTVSTKIQDAPAKRYRAVWDGKTEIVFAKTLE